MPRAAVSIAACRSERPCASSPTSNGMGLLIPDSPIVTTRTASTEQAADPFAGLRHTEHQEQHGNHDRVVPHQPSLHFVQLGHGALAGNQVPDHYTADRDARDEDKDDQDE